MNLAPTAGMMPEFVMPARNPITRQRRETSAVADLEKLGHVIARVSRYR